GVSADAAHHGGHDAAAPEGLGQPVADLDAVRLAELEVQATTADQVTVSVSAGPMAGPALPLGCLRDDSQPRLEVRLGVRIGNAEGAVVDLLFLQMFNDRGLVGGQDL